MKYIIFKSKIFGESKVNLTEAIDGKKIVLNEDVQKENIKDIEKVVSTEYKKNLPEIKKEIENAVAKAMGSPRTEKKIEEIVANCLVQLYKQLWYKRSVWKSGIKNNPN